MVPYPELTLNISLAASVVKSLTLGALVSYRVDSGKWTPGLKVTNMENTTRFAFDDGKPARQMLLALNKGKQVEFNAGGKVLGPFRLFGLKDNREYYPC